MLLMEQKILAEGKVLPGNILKVGSFLNQSIDTAFLREIGREIGRLYEGCGVSKILTIEASGIAIAVAAGMEMGVNVVFAKKHKSSNVDGQVYSSVVHSSSYNPDYPSWSVRIIFARRTMCFWWTIFWPTARLWRA